MKTKRIIFLLIILHHGKKQVDLFMIEFPNIEGFTYKISTRGTAEEALRAVGLGS